MDRLTYVGHATVLLELDGLRLLTDPLLTARVGHLARTSRPPTISGLDIDAILISHLHVDHLHLPSLSRLAAGRLLLAPRGAAGFLTRHGFGPVAEMDAGEVVTLKGIDIEATPANHPNRHMPGRPRTRALGYVIHARRRVYFAGDTDLFHGMADIGDRLDVALLPVWGWGPTLGVGHLDPFRAAQALQMLQPALAVPIHWGTYFPLGLRSFLPGLLHRPPRAFADYAAHLAPATRVCLLEPGEALDIKAALR
ncbi:MAG: MBL fold metallo-hydrolase [Candidatus Promineofilum sp.]|nr:MBL fold metallo-hydrolase [Promineifilum sp.]